VRSSVVTGTPERAELFEVQPPQVFNADLIKGAIAAAAGAKKQYADDCAAVEAIGGTVHITKGSYENLKLTTPEDMLIAEAVLKNSVKGSDPV
ncbi:MAG: 2-C-methyl-D-erythritol 4-phosphate cytidylyltransferase, partial [Clostridiales bacterium]|nr:2-C-methyl-D-erythritol 4-phosphate cytidylyltransferase [Clostridiales bacterium]